MKKKAKATADDNRLSRAGFSEPESSEKHAFPQSGVDDSVGTTGSQEVVPIKNESKGISNESIPNVSEKFNASVTTNSLKNDLPTKAQAMDTRVGGSINGVDVPNVSVKDMDSKQGLQTEAGVMETAPHQPEKKEHVTNWAEPAGSSVESTHGKAGKLDISVAVTEPKEIVPRPAAALDTSVESEPKEVDRHGIGVGAKDLQQAHHTAMDKSFERATKQVDGNGVTVSHSEERLSTESKELGTSVDSAPQEAQELGVGVSHSVSTNDPKGVFPTQNETKGISVDSGQEEAGNFIARVGGSEFKQNAPNQDEGALTHAEGLTGYVEQELSSVIAAHCQQSTCGFAAEGDTGSAHEVPGTRSAHEVPEPSVITHGWNRAIHPGDYTWNSQDTQSEGFLRLCPNGQWWHAVHRHAKERARIVDPQHQQSNQPTPSVDIRRAYKEHTDKPDVHSLDGLRGTYKEFEVWELVECLGSWQEVLIPGTTGDVSQECQVPQRTHGVLLLCEHCGWKDNFPNAPLSRHPDKEEKEEVHEMVSSGSIKLCYALRSDLPNGDAFLEFLMTPGDVCDAGGLSVTETPCARTRNVQVAFQALGFGRKYTQQSKPEAQVAEQAV